jgi:hypothetical protein
MAWEGKSTMKIISRQEAKVLGLKYYFTGNPCKHRHICERRVRDGRCMECDKLFWRKWYREHAEEIKEQLHIRYVKNPEKVKERVREWRIANPDKKREASRRYRLKYPEKIREKHFRRYWENVERESERKRKYLQKRNLALKIVQELGLEL